MLHNILRSFLLFLTLFLSLIIFVIPSFSQNNSKNLDIYPRVDVRPGDHCTVSGKELNQSDLCLLVEGRRVPLKKEALDIFLENPEKYFSKLQPKSALFTEDMKQETSLSVGWFIFGVYILIGLIFAALTSYKAVAKGLSPNAWFFAGLFFNVFGYIFLLTRKDKDGLIIPPGLTKVPITNSPILCPACNYQNHPSAGKCSNCKNILSPRIKSEAERLAL